MQEGGRSANLLSLFRDLVLPLADAYAATRSSFRWSPEDSSLVIGDRRLPVERLARIYLVGAGKAGVPMARAVVDTLQEDAELWSRFAGGTVNVYQDQANATIPGVRLFAADHPNPNQASMDGASAAVEMLAQATDDDLVIAAISGGGSSMLTLPSEGICLEDFCAANRVLITGGATIQEINTVRKPLSRVKGGRLRLAAPDALFVTLILSDVIGDDLSSIASGPTVPDSTTCREAIAVLEQHELWERVPEACRSHLLKGDPDEVNRRILWRDRLANRTHNVIVASNAVVLRSLHRLLSLPEHSGLASHVVLEESPVTGEVGEAVDRHFARAAALSVSSGPGTLLLCGGEPTVSVPAGARGVGGRMLHYALLTATKIAGRDWAVLASGTDGVDGTAPAAGAVVTGGTLDLARTYGLDPFAYLESYDSYGFFRQLEERSGSAFLNITGPTGTNVNDIILWLL